MQHSHTATGSSRATTGLRRIARLLAMGLVVATLAPGVGLGDARAADGAPVGEEARNPDPWEKMNRKVHAFNVHVDRAIVKPVAVRYARHVPPRVRRGVRNFFNNLREPSTIVNDLLQGKFARAGCDSLRFLINSTAGVLGVFDVAAHLDMPRHREDFGQTLARWGAPPGPYLVLPLLGPSTVRDTAGLVPHHLYTDVTATVEDDALLWTLFAARGVDSRAALLAADELLETQLDPYAFLRESYLQQRIHAIGDGEHGEREDEFLNEILERDQD